MIITSLLAYGYPPQATVVAYLLDKCTVMKWQERTGEHCKQVHEHLEYQPCDLEHVHADEIRAKA